MDYYINGFVGSLIGVGCFCLILILCAKKDKKETKQSKRENVQEKESGTVLGSQLPDNPMTSQPDSTVVTSQNGSTIINVQDQGDFDDGYDSIMATPSAEPSPQDEHVPSYVEFQGEEDGEFEDGYSTVQPDLVQQMSRQDEDDVEDDYDRIWQANDEKREAANDKNDVKDNDDDDIDETTEPINVENVGEIIVDEGGVQRVVAESGDIYTMVDRKSIDASKMMDNVDEDDDESVGYNELEIPAKQFEPPMYDNADETNRKFVQSIRL